MTGDVNYSSQNRIEVLPTQILIESRTLAQMAAAIEALHDAFDDAALTYAGSSYVHVSIRRTGFAGPEEHSGVWTYTADYLIQRAKVRL